MTGAALAVAVALTLALPALAPGVAAASGGCDRVAAPTGSDRARGTVADPLRSVQALLDALAPGATGCLRSGHYDGDDEIKLEARGVTLRSFPGERAVVGGRIWVTEDAPGAVIADLDLDGRNEEGLPSPTINGDGVAVLDSDITNHHTGICISVGSPETFGRAEGTLISGNTIHDCGVLPATNFDHGIYVNSADGTVIVGNVITDNSDRGVQLYPDAQGSLVAGNVITGNGEGLIFGGDAETASSGNLVIGNQITGATIRADVESSWGGPIGTGNYLIGNCIGAAGSPTGIGFSGFGNRVLTAADRSCADPTP